MSGVIRWVMSVSPGRIETCNGSTGHRSTAVTVACMSWQAQKHYERVDCHLSMLDVLDFAPSTLDLIVMWQCKELEEKDSKVKKGKPSSSQITLGAHARQGLACVAFIGLR